MSLAHRGVSSKASSFFKELAFLFFSILWLVYWARFKFHYAAESSAFLGRALLTARHERCAQRLAQQK